jgi:hypothetical protein
VQDQNFEIFNLVVFGVGYNSHCFGAKASPPLASTTEKEDIKSM